jgi:hypothetical protein
VSHDLIKDTFRNLYTTIERHADGLPDALNTIGGEEDTHEGEDEEEVQELLADIISTLDVVDSGRFPDDWRNWLPQAARGPIASLQDTVVLHQWAPTIYRLARHDRFFRERLRNALTERLCARAFIEKLEYAVEDTFKGLMEYRTRGPNYSEDLINGCAWRLRHIVTQIAEYRNGRRAPLPAEYDDEAASLAIRILSEVCNWNVDIYQLTAWNTSGQEPQHDRDRNLFANLIQSPAPEFAGDVFVLDLLMNTFPFEAWRNERPRLEQIRRSLLANSAPTAYLQTLEELLGP